MKGYTNRYIKQQALTSKGLPTIPRRNREGAILGLIMVILFALSLLVIALFNLAAHSEREANYEMKAAQAFWLAEAGVQWCINDMFDLNGNDGIIGETQANPTNSGTFEVLDDSDASGDFRVSIGKVTIGSQTVERRIRIGLGYAPDPFNNVVHAENDGGLPWTLMMRGSQYGGNDGPRVPTSQNSHYPGGNDIFIGDVNVNGSFRMYDEARVDDPISIYDINGDVTYTSEFSDEVPGTSIAGSTINASSGSYNAPDLSGIDYASQADVINVAQSFADAGITSGRLPANHPLHDVVIMNPSDRSSENSATAGHDFYFESSGNNYGNNTPSTGEAPLSLGTDETYYVEGHVWFHKYGPYGSLVDGQAVIVSTKDIHISDNITYSDRSSDSNGDLLALVALGEYDSFGDLVSGTGNIYFGDPGFGTLYTCDAFMFANNDFLYNTSANDGSQQEPESGFKVFGNFMAMNRVIINRDWYQQDGTSTYLAAEYVQDTDSDGNTIWVWKDINDGTVLSSNEESSLRHYAMQVEYDDRIRSQATSLSGLPKLPYGTLFTGILSWAADTSVN